MPLRRSHVSSSSLVAAFCLTGVAILAGRRWRAGRPLRRSRALLVDAFGLALLMIATLFLLLVSGGPVVPEIRWATFVTLGLAPLAFLIGLLDARLARTALGDLMLELRDDPSPAVLREALASALRDPSLTLAYWLPEYGTWADVDGRAVDLATLADSRPMRLIEKDGTKIAALYHDPRSPRRARAARRRDRGSRYRARERTAARRAAGTSRRAARIARASHRGGPGGAAAARARSARRRPAASDRARSSSAGSRVASTETWRAGNVSSRRGAKLRRRSKSCAPSLAASIPRL